MRSYYHVRHIPLCFRWPSSGTSDAMKLLYRRFQYFREGHLKNDTFHSVWSSWEVTGIYVYRENGAFYEFFSGDRIGDWAIRVYDASWSGSDYLCAYELTPSQFASDVEPYMKYRRKIGKVMHEFFDLHEQMRAEANRESNRRRAQREARDAHDASWLESFLDNR